MNVAKLTAMTAWLATSGFATNASAQSHANDVEKNSSLVARAPAVSCADLVRQAKAAIEKETPVSVANWPLVPSCHNDKPVPIRTVTHHIPVGNIQSFIVSPDLSKTLVQTIDALKVIDLTTKRVLSTIPVDRTMHRTAARVSNDGKSVEYIEWKKQNPKSAQLVAWTPTGRQSAPIDADMEDASGGIDFASSKYVLFSRGDKFFIHDIDTHATGERPISGEINTGPYYLDEAGVLHNSLSQTNIKIAGRIRGRSHLSVRNSYALVSDSTQAFAIDLKRGTQTRLAFKDAVLLPNGKQVISTSPPYQSFDLSTGQMASINNPHFVGGDEVKSWPGHLAWAANDIVTVYDKDLKPVASMPERAYLGSAESFPTPHGSVGGNDSSLNIIQYRWACEQDLAERPSATPRGLESCDLDASLLSAALHRPAPLSLKDILAACQGDPTKAALLDEIDETMSVRGPNDTLARQWFARRSQNGSTVYDNAHRWALTLLSDPTFMEKNPSLYATLAAADSSYISTFPKGIDKIHWKNFDSTCLPPKGVRDLSERVREHLHSYLVGSTDARWDTIPVFAPFLAQLPTDDRTTYLDNLGRDIADGWLDMNDENEHGRSRLIYLMRAGLRKRLDPETYKPLSDASYGKDKNGAVFAHIYSTEPLPENADEPAPSPLSGFIHIRSQSIPLQSSPHGGAPRFDKDLAWTTGGSEYRAHFEGTQDSSIASKYRFGDKADRKGWLNDGIVTGLVIASPRLADNEHILNEYKDYFKDNGFDVSEVRRNVDTRQFLENGIRTGELDWLSREGHAGGGDRSLLFFHETSRVVVAKGKTPEGKPEVVYLLYPGQTPNAWGSERGLDFDDVREWMKARDETAASKSGELLFLNTACSTFENAVREMDHVRSPNFVEVGTKATTYCFNNASRWPPYMVIDGIRNNRSYASIRNAIGDYLKGPANDVKGHQYVFPDDPEYRSAFPAKAANIKVKVERRTPERTWKTIENLMD